MQFPTLLPVFVVAMATLQVAQSQMVSITMPAPESDATGIAACLPPAAAAPVADAIFETIQLTEGGDIYRAYAPNTADLTSLASLSTAVDSDNIVTCAREAESAGSLMFAYSEGQCILMSKRYDLSSTACTDQDDVLVYVLDSAKGVGECYIGDNCG